jgi:hypothetical protein
MGDTYTLMTCFLVLSGGGEHIFPQLLLEVPDMGGTFLHGTHARTYRHAYIHAYIHTYLHTYTSVQQQP